MKSTTWVALGLALALALGPAYPASASDPAPTNQNDNDAPQESTANSLGLGLGSVITSFFYAPVKIGYAALGGVTGGMGWLLTGGDSEVATRVFRPSMRGTYVLTPSHLTGEAPIHFVGASTISSRGTADSGDAGRTASTGGKVEEEQF